MPNLSNWLCVLFPINNSETFFNFFVLATEIRTSMQKLEGQLVFLRCHNAKSVIQVCLVQDRSFCQSFRFISVAGVWPSDCVPPSDFT